MHRSRLVALWLLTTCPVAACSHALRQDLGLVSTHPPVLRTASDTVETARTLGELTEQLRGFAHRLTLQHAMPPSSDVAAGMAAADYAGQLPRSVTIINTSQTPLDITTAVAPLIGSASSLCALMDPVAGIRSFEGPARLLSEQLVPVLRKTRNLIAELERVR